MPVEMPPNVGKLLAPASDPDSTSESSMRSRSQLRKSSLWYGLDIVTDLRITDRNQDSAVTKL